MVKVFFEIERVQTRKVWLFFLLVLLFYFITLSILSVGALLFLGVWNPRLFPLLFQAPLTFFSVVFLFSLACSFFHIVYSLQKGPDMLLQALEAYKADPEDRYHRIFQNVVSEMAIAMGERNLEPRIYPSTSMNAVSIKGWDGKGYFAVSEGAIARLNRSQLQALVAQGVARCATGEAFLSTVACCLAGVYPALIQTFISTQNRLLDRYQDRTPIYLGWGRSTHRGERVVGAIAVLLLLQFVTLVLQSLYSLINAAISREHGLLADATAVRLTRNPLALAEAFYIMDHSWRGFAIKTYLAPLYALPPGTTRDEEEPSLFDTHPPTHQRIAILLEMAHTDGQELPRALKEAFRSPPITQEVEELEKKQPQWLVRHETEWKGPFSTEELINLPFVHLDSWLRAANAPESAAFPLYAAPKLAKAVAHRQSGDSLQCPCGHGSLMYREKTGLKVAVCPHCEGTFVPRSKLIRILVRREEAFSERTVQFAEELESRRNTLAEQLQQERLERQEEGRLCAKCAQPMTVRLYNLQYPIIVDECGDCNSLWFDAQELEALQYLVERERLKEAL